MGSKSVLILGIVFIFLLNVLAMHHYIDNYYYQPNKIINKKDNNLSISSMVKDVIEIEDDKNISITKEEKNKVTIPKVATIIEKTKEQEDNKNKNKTKPKEDLLNELSNKLKNNNKILKDDFKKDNSKNIKIINNKIKEKDSREKNALIVLNLNVNDTYQKGNPIIKKMVQKLNNNRTIKIVIHKYSIKIKDYLKEIKDEIVDYGVDIDDIKVIYKKNENKKDKIKILLTKKD